jgi:L-ascorbate metabolism protein UlaG (beta-lactamase superfamily)
MKIKKIGHCCLVIEINGKKIMTDPGAYSAGQENERDLCAILITHEHADHFHIGSLKRVLEANPEAVVVTNESVGVHLREAGIPFTKIEDSETESVNGILIEGYGLVHAHIYDTIPPLQNTGYFIDNRFFYPGDAFYNPSKQVEILALPMAGPWMKLAEALDYLKFVHPKACFNVHDALMIPERSLMLRKLPEEVCRETGSTFVYLKDGQEAEF